MRYNLPVLESTSHKAYWFGVFKIFKKLVPVFYSYCTGKLPLNQFVILTTAPILRCALRKCRVGTCYAIRTKSAITRRALASCFLMTKEPRSVVFSSFYTTHKFCMFSLH